MHEKETLKGIVRTVRGKQVRALRRQGFLPAVVYGHGLEPFPVQLPAREAGKVLARAGGATLIGLELDGQETRNVLVRDIQRDPLSQQTLHVDLYQVRMDEEIRVAIPVRLTGKAPAVREKDGILVQGLNELEIECLPGDLITSVSADLSGLVNIGDSITVKDLTVPSTVKVLNDPDEMIAVVTYQAAEAVIEEAPVVVAEVEVVEKGKKEEEGEEEE